jgi:integrase
MKIFLKINQIKDMLELTEAEPRDMALFHVAFNTGLRVSDLLSLKRKNFIDREGEIAKVLRVKMIKTKQIIDRPLRDDCREVIRHYLAGRQDKNPYMFPPKQIKSRYGCNRNRPMCRMSAHRLFKKYLGEMYSPSELRGAATHTLRRSVAKIISEVSGRIEPASKFLGHRSTAPTAAYIDMDSHEEKANEIITTIEI